MEGLVIGQYCLQRQLGAGGMGAVYEAVHRQIGRRAAVKLLHPHFAQQPTIVRRFLNEARATSKVDHPGLVTIFEYGSLEDHTVFLIMEYLPGETLRQRLKRKGGRLPIAEAMFLASQIAISVAAAHAHDIVHRDLKPENVMIIADPTLPGGERVKVLDFGIAKWMTDGGSLHTDTGALLGTPLYMSPEQCHGAEGVNPKSDVYSLGAMLYEMLAGQPPFTAAGQGMLFVMHMTRDPRPLRQLAPHVCPSLAALAHAMLAKSAAQRPTMQQCGVDLQDASLLRSPRPADLMRRYAPFAALGLALAGLAASLLWLRHPESRAASAPAPAPQVSPMLRPSPPSPVVPVAPSPMATAKPAPKQPPPRRPQKYYKVSGNRRTPAPSQAGPGIIRRFEDDPP